MFYISKFLFHFFFFFLLHFLITVFLQWVVYELCEAKIVF